MGKKNVYLPVKAVVRDVKELAKDVTLFTIDPTEELSYQPGQFLMVSRWGVGEVPISITSTPDGGDGIELCIRAVGHVTAAVNSLKTGDFLWVRGPYGKPFPMGNGTRDTLVICGGIGVVPLRPLINQLLNTRKKGKAKGKTAGNITIIYGSRDTGEVMFMDEVSSWEERGAKVIMTVDACDIESWNGCIGLVTEHIDSASIDFKDCTAYICGPHVMIQAAMRDLSLRGMPDNRIITTLEAHMKCGVGKCGHCFCGGKLICEDGPVFTFEEIKTYAIRPGIDTTG